MKYIISLIALSAVSLSTALTLVFMVQIGSPTGLTAVFIGVGLVMELTKTVLPVLVLKAHHSDNNAHTLALGTLTALLMAVSFSASIVSVEAGAEGTRKLSTEYQDLTHQIDTIQTKATDTRKRLSSLPTDYITQRSTLNTEANSLDAKAAELLNQQAVIEPNSIIVKYGSAIAVITATIIELITFLFVPSMFDGSRRTQVVRTPVPTIESSIRKSIINRDIEPTHRSVRTRYTGISTSRIADLLTSLGDEGILVRNGRGWVYP